MACHTAAIDDLNDEDESQAAARLDEMVDLELSTAKDSRERSDDDERGDNFCSPRLREFGYKDKHEVLGGLAKM